MDTATILTLQQMSTSASVTTQPPAARRPRLMDYLSLFFGLTTLVGFVLAYYWHAQSVQERAPSYQVSPTRARIVDTSIPAPPQLQVLYKGKDLNANLSAAIVYFWNDGKLPIKSEDVLEPIKIELEPECQILDARILKISRSLTNLTKGEVSESAKNVLPLSFRILEHNDGAVLQIIYSGKPEANLVVTGAVVGAGVPREFLSQQSRPTDISHRWKRILVLGALLIAANIVNVVAIIFLNRTWKRTAALALGMIVGQVVAFGIAAYFIHRSSQPVVPSTIWMNR